MNETGEGKGQQGVRELWQFGKNMPYHYSAIVSCSHVGMYDLCGLVLGSNWDLDQAGNSLLPFSHIGSPVFFCFNTYIGC